MKNVISKRGDSIKVKGDFFVTYSAERGGEKYITTHLNPCGGSSSFLSADDLNKIWQSKYKGLNPFNGDSNFEVLHIQQRFN